MINHIVVVGLMLVFSSIVFSQSIDEDDDGYDYVNKTYKSQNDLNKLAERLSSDAKEDSNQPKDLDFNNMYDALHITNSQKVKLQKIRVDRSKIIACYVDVMKELNQEIRTVLLAENLDEKKLADLEKRIGEEDLSLLHGQIQMLLDSRKVLTPEQLILLGKLSVKSDEATSSTNKKKRISLLSRLKASFQFLENVFALPNLRR